MKSSRLLLAFLPALFCFSFLVKNDKPSEPVPHSCFDAFNDSAVDDLGFLDTIVPRYRLILVGEFHGVAVNPALQMKMIRYLYTHAHMRHLVMEYGPAEAYLYQRYLETGDEKYVLDSWQYKMPEYVRFWHELYQFNKTVQEKVDVIGIDFDSDHVFAKALADLLPADAVPADSIRPMMDSVAYYARTITSFTADQFVNRFSDDFHKHYPLYQKLYGDRFGRVILFAENQSSYYRMKERDHQMFVNFSNAYPDTCGYFGMFGWSHAYTGWEKSFAYQVNTSEDLPDFTGKVLGIGVCYDSCSYYYRYAVNMVGADEAIQYMKGKSSRRMVEKLRSEAGCNAALFAIKSSQDELAKEASTEADLMIYVRKSRATGFNK